MTIPAAARAFLANLGWGQAAIAPLAGDASFRRYFRVDDGERRAVLMDAPPPHEDPRPFLEVARWLQARGFAAPAIYGEALDAGLVLIEDFGDRRMREAIDEGADPWPLYQRATDLLVRLHREAAGPFAPHDAAMLRDGAMLVTDWYCPAVGIKADADAYRALWERMLAPIMPAQPVTVLRDYHAENLMLLADDALGLLDFQDARVGHPAYDLVSLLQDARRDVEPEIEAAMLRHYREATGAGEAFERDYHLLGAQRNARVIGVFTRLWKRDGKPRYPTLVPRVWGYLERDLAHPALAEMRAWFDANIPPAQRGDPMLLAGGRGT